MNFKECRPAAKSKLAAKKKAPLAPPLTQQTVLTNALIAEKLSQRTNPTSDKPSEETKKTAKVLSARSGASSHVPSSSRTTLSAPKGGVIKTVVLPHEDFNRLGVEGQQLANFLKVQEQLFQDTVNAYQKDRSVRMQEFDLKERDFNERFAELQARLAERKALNYQISTEYFGYKHAIDNARLSLEDQIKLAKVENESLKESVNKILEAEKADEVYSENLYSQKTEQFAARFRRNTQKNEQELNTIKVQYSTVQDEYLKELKRLEREINIQTQRARVYETRRDTDSVAFTNDIQIIRKRVLDYERHIKKLKHHVDKEDTESLVKELQNQQLTELDLGKLADEIHKIEEEIKEAKRLKVKF